jgi:hypothetical protein
MAPLLYSGLIFQRSLTLYWQNFRPFVVLGGLVWVATFIGASMPYIGQRQYLLVYRAVSAATIAASYLVSWMSLTWAASDALNGRPTSIAAELGKVTFRPFCRIACVSALTALFVVPGFVALIAPGIILATRLSLAGPIALLEDMSAPRALVESWLRVKGHTAPMFGTLLLLLLPAVLLASADQLFGALKPLWLTLPVVALFLIVEPLFRVGLTVLYYDFPTPRLGADELTALVGSLVLAISCPPWYCAKQRRWVGLLCAGLISVYSVTFIVESILAIPKTPVGSTVGLAVAVMLWLLCGGFVLLGDRRPILGNLLLAVLVLVLTILAVASGLSSHQRLSR